jgi:hypothetical protein
MLEASMLLHRDSANYLRGMAASGPMAIAVSNTLLDIANSEPDWLLRRLAPFLGVSREEADLTFLRYLREDRRLSLEVYRGRTNSEHLSYSEGARAFKDVLAENVGDKLVAEILFEEWLFLTSNSWLFSRTRRAFDEMAQAGGTAVHVSRQLFEQVIRKTLKIAGDKDLTPCDRLRAGAKWIAVGGPPVVALLNPLAGALAASVTGCILLMDP